MRDREPTALQVGIEWLDVAQRGLTGGRIADMTARDAAGQGADNVVAVEIARNMTHRAMGVEMIAVEAGDARGFLSAMLQRMQSQRHERRRTVAAGDAEHPAFLAELVVFERVRGQHRRGSLAWCPVAYRDGGRVCRHLVTIVGSKAGN